MNIQDAVDFPRFHHQWLPDTLLVDQRISPDTVDLLAELCPPTFCTFLRELSFRWRTRIPVTT
jgi:hypothetical protein